MKDRTIPEIVGTPSSSEIRARWDAIMTTKIVAPGVNPDKPGLYLWRVEGVGAYIGVYSHLGKRMGHYRRTITRYIQGRPFSDNPTDKRGFRLFLRALAEAVQNGREVTLTVLENEPDKPRRHARERALIVQYGASLNSIAKNLSDKPDAGAGDRMPTDELGRRPRH